MSEEWEKYVADPRPICKYGVKCYQKNPQHHNQYKHPPQNTKRKKYNQDANAKRFKPQDSTAKDDKLLTSSDSTNEQDLKKSPRKIGTQNVNKNTDLEKCKLRNQPKDLTFYFKPKDSSKRKKDLHHASAESTSQQDLNSPLSAETQILNENSDDVEKAIKKLGVTKELPFNAETADKSAESTSKQHLRNSPVETDTQSDNDNSDIEKAVKKLDVTKELTFNDKNADISAESTKQQDLRNSPVETEIQFDNENSDVKKVIIEEDVTKELTFYDNTVDTEELLNRLFLTKMPKDFYKFYECLKEDGSAEDTLARVNLQLVGPYDLLLGKLPIVNDELYLIHWRFFYDPPEFQTVLKVKGNSQLHYGYFRDNPEDKPEFVASNDSAKGCLLTPVADNIFGAVYLHLESEKKRSPFISIASQKIMEKIKKWAETHKFSLEAYNAKKRTAKAVTRTFHGAGIMVPYDKKTQIGYRPLVETNDTIKKLFARLKNAESKTIRDKVLSELQPVITYASIAMDEGDFGTALEIGINLFCSGIKILEASSMASLTSAYNLLNRKAYVEIIKAHLKYRRKGSDMSLLSLNDS